MAGDILFFGDSFLPIEINYTNARKYAKCRTYDQNLMKRGYTWHQIIVVHMGELRELSDSQTLILDAIFNAVDNEEFYPVAYRRGPKHDRFLVRSCQLALDKLFERNLRLQLSNGVFVKLEVHLNVADYKLGQISPSTLISRVLNKLYDNMEQYKDEDGILNLSNFGRHNAFEHVIVNLNNLAVFKQICEYIYRNDDKFRSVNGLILSGNGISTVAPLQVFTNVDFILLDLRDNNICSASRLCRDLKNFKATDLMLAGNPIIQSKKYPESLKPLAKNFKFVDSVPFENLSKSYTPLDYDVDIDCDGYKIDWSNKNKLENFKTSYKWHAVMIPDPEEEFSKETIFDYFFISVSQELSAFYPCYYKYFAGEHRFLVRECYDQLEHLAVNCNLEIKIPSLISTITDDSSGSVPAVKFDRSIVFYLLMDVGPFKVGQVDVISSIEKAIDTRFNAMDRVLNLENFQSAEGLENIIVMLNFNKIITPILTKSARKFLNNCNELRLGHNKILNLCIPKTIKMMTNLQAVDLGNNWIQDLSEIKALESINLKSLRLDGNPLCKNFSLASEYIKAVKQYFPHLTKLDNVNLLTKRVIGSQKNFICNLGAYELVEVFVKQFFETYESPDRISLERFYSSNALFTMTCNYNVGRMTAPSLKRLSKYTINSTNILKLSDLSRASNGFQVGPNEIMNTLMQLPEVKHDFLSFTIDVMSYNENMVNIIVSGVFKDIADAALETEMLMAFNRNFILKVVDRNAGILKRATVYQIINERFNIMSPTQLQHKHAFKFFKNVDPPKDEDIKVADKECLLVMLQEMTGLRPIWCTRCLEDAEWKFQRALEIFVELESKNEIPDNAFV